jgi:hypothetical protein
MGGDGLALPAGTCSLMKPTIFFAMTLLLAGDDAWAFGLRLPGVERLFDVAFAAEPERQRTPDLDRTEKGQERGLVLFQAKFQVFSTWLNSSSTGVARPKIMTETRTLLFS